MRLPVRFALLACAVLIIAPGCKKKDEGAAGGSAKAAASASTASMLAVSIAPVTTRQMARGLTVSGPVAAVEEMQLGVELSGLRVTSLDVDVGQWVKRGQLLLTLDHRSLDSDLAQADASLKEAQAGAALAQSNLARGQQLASGKYISASQLDELRATRVQADAHLATARAARDAVALRRSYADLRAPAAGLVSKRLVQPGQVVAAGSELLRLIRDGRLEWRSELPSDQLARVHAGDRIVLHARDGQPVDGIVRAVTPGVDATTRTGTVYANLPQPGSLQPGTYLEGRIDTGLGDALAVPTAAVVLRDGFPTVFTVDDAHKVHALRIEQGAKDGGFVEVRDGLKAGQQVVVEGAGFLAEGDDVRVVPPTAQPAAAAPAATQP